MNNPIFKKLCMILFVLFSFSVAVNAQDSLGNSAQDSLNSSQQLYQEYMQISQRLQLVQQQALQDEKIAQQTSEFSSKVETEMLKDDPTLKAKIDERNKIIEDFKSAQAENNQDKMVQLQKDYQTIAQEIQPYEQKAMQDEDLQARGQELEEAVIDKMNEIDPEIPQLREKLKELNTKLQQEKQ